eukprot:scaffold5013_cov83-Isochrysis_galbana.AAC.2
MMRAPEQRACAQVMTKALHASDDTGKCTAHASTVALDQIKTSAAAIAAGTVATTAATLMASLYS